MKASAVETFPLASRADAGSLGFAVKITASDGTVGYRETDTLPVAAERSSRRPAIIRP